MNTSAQVIAYLLVTNETMPNHPRWPLLLYPGAVAIAGADPAQAFEVLFTRNRWPAAWRNGVYPFHHYHSNAHEVLGIYSGEVTVQFGGEAGVVLTARAGDVIVLPAGTGHKRIGSRGTLGVVGAYPAGAQPDMCKPDRTDPARGAAQVAKVALPECDPVLGEDGPLFKHWL